MIPFAVIKLFFGGLLKRLLGAVAALVSLIGRYPWQAACVALLALSAFMWRGKANAIDERDMARAETKAVLARSEENLAAAKAQVKAYEAKYSKLAKDNADAEQIIRTVYVDRSDRNAERMRFDKICGSNPTAPTKDQPAPFDNGPGPEAVVVGRTDYDILVENTVRLEAAHQWGQSLVKDGLATLPEVGF